tara:strand:+ start:49099 stop:49461 length:363 start_codon:yes stop_codon:yes gene_type:complete
MVLKKGFLKAISFILIIILGSGILKTTFNSYFNESHEFSYLDFAHVHTHSHSHSQNLGASTADSHEDCHGSMVNGFVFLAVSFDQFADLILKLKFNFTSRPNSIYQDPDSDPLRKPPRFS